MIALGALGLLQVCFAPGYLLLKLSRWQARSVLQFVVYAFALSLIVNYCAVSVLTALGIYNSTTVYVLMLVEAALALRLWSTRGFVLRSQTDLSQWARHCFDNFGLRHATGCLAFGLAIASLYAFVLVFYNNFGTIFDQWDDVNSWDAWAEIWAAGQFPGGTGLYPQLLPTNWSIAYLSMQTTDVKLFAKAIMPLFSIAALLLFADLAARRKSTDYLVSLAIYACMEYTFIALFIPTGYMETALAFFGLLTVYALLDLREGVDPHRVLLASLFSGGAGLVKQGGLYFTALAVVWLGVEWYRRRGKKSDWKRLAWASAAGVALVVPWYYRWYSLVRRGAEASNISYLAALSAHGRTLFGTAYGAMIKLYNVRGNLGKPFCWFLALTLALSLFDRVGRKVLMWVVVPLLVLWALFFSYEVRTVSLTLSAAALCSGVGTGTAVRFLRQIAPSWSGLGSVRTIFYAAAVLLVVAYGLYDSRIRNALTGGWERDGMAEIARTWVKPLGLAAVTLWITGWLAIRRQSRITVNWLLVAGCGACLWLFTPVPSSATIVQRQLELQKHVGVPALNDRIYETLNSRGLDGKIATDYWYLQRLPILKNYMFGYGFPLSVSAADLARAASQKGVCYVVIQDERLDASAKDALAQPLYHTVATEDGYRFIETCRGQYAQEDNGAAALTAELDLPSREKNGPVGCGVLAFGPDGHDDLVFKLDLAVKPDSPPLNAEITYLELQRHDLPGIFHTSNSHFLLGVAQVPGGPLLNSPNGPVKLPIQTTDHLWLYVCDDGANRPGRYHARVRVGRDSWVESKSVTLRQFSSDRQIETDR